jgi:hypothetical protein
MHHRSRRKIARTAAHSSGMKAECCAGRSRSRAFTIPNRLAIRVPAARPREVRSTPALDTRHCVERVREFPAARKTDLVGFAGNRERSSQTAVPTPKEKVIHLL